MPADFEIADAEVRDGALIRDVRIPAPEGDGSPIEAYLVEPEIVDARKPRPGLLFAHWYDTEAPNGNRTEFVDEAADWARRHRAAAILPQLTFPWEAAPTGSEHDRASILRELARLHRCLDVVLGRPAVDGARVGVVGHDFGGMHAALLASDDRRAAAYVLVAAVPRWADWFLAFWPITEDRIAYLGAMRDLDPIEHLRRVAPARILFQLGQRDFFVAPMTGFEFQRAAGDTAERKTYDAEHDLAVPDAVADRTAFLESILVA
jgi:dienelactone hydrolase